MDEGRTFMVYRKGHVILEKEKNRLVSGITLWYGSVGTESEWC